VSDDDACCEVVSADGLGRDTSWYCESVTVAEHTDCVLSVLGIDHRGVPGIRPVYLHAVLTRWRTRSASTKAESLVKPLENIEFFAQVAVDQEAGTLVWPNGVDLCPDVLYAEATGKDIQELGNELEVA
jgi:hypothetical protein